MIILSTNNMFWLSGNDTNFTFQYLAWMKLYNYMYICEKMFAIS